MGSELSLNAWNRLSSKTIVSNLLTERSFITNGLSCLLMVFKIVLEAVILVFEFFLFSGGGWVLKSTARYAAYANKSLSSSVFERRTSIAIRILLS